ncbi:MAG TPA: hypothetical protein VN461_11455 [Vicinamibacteria bacterium]|jgi:hypothetical protein|nr:hypothetical protein [Vicinamibacteria bacterium]
MSSMNGRKGPITRGVVLGLVLAVLAVPALAQVVKKAPSPLDKLVMAKRELRVSRTLTYAEAVKEPLAYRADIKRFQSEYGSSWRFLIDERTGRANLVEGGAIPFIPGPANKLRWQDFGADCDRPSCIPRAKMESLAREFLVRNRVALQVNPEELVLDPVGTVPVGNSVYFVRFQWAHGGVPVEGGSVFLAINNGNLIQVGVTNIGDIKLDPKPTLPLDRAKARLESYVGGMDRDKWLDQGSLGIIPITPPGLDPDAPKVPFGKMIGYMLVYKFAFQRPGVLGSWEALVNANTGDLVRFIDTNAYGHIQGGVYKTDKPQTEVTEPFADTDYGAAICTDTSGNFPGVGGTSTMTGCPGVGVAGGVKITDNCGAISRAGNPIGLIDFANQAGVGTDCTTPGVGGAGNTHSARTQDWNVTQIKMKGFSYLPTNAWLQAQLTDVVNLTGTCNAFWDGTKLNFYQAFGGCNNTGELPGVSMHEWGHGMDSNDGSGAGTDNKPIESRADWTAILQTHQSCTGSGFLGGSNCGGYGDACTACTGVRDADWAQHTHPTAWTPQNNGQVNPGYTCAPGPYNGPCGWEDHCESGIPTQALWDLVNRDLVAAPTNLDIVSAWQLEDRLFYTGMPQSTNMYTCTGTTTKTSNGCGAGSLYTVLRAIDDDGDGPANGTPHAAAIFAALNRHGIACGLAGDPANQNQTSCPSLTTPTLTAAANNQQVTLNWTTGGLNATRYFVFRNETSCSAGFTRIATVTAPTLTYTDNGVVHGATYYYRIQAATANDSCVSPMSGCATAVTQLPGDKDFYVRDWTDTALSHDLGQEPSTNYTTNWAYSSDVWNRGSNTPGTPVNDWYPTDNMFAGAGTLGDNYGFVRVSRNATGSTATVTAEFLVSPFGAGSNFASVGTATLNFAAADQSLVQSSYWNQPATASTHACIAVQISTPDDPYKSPSLNGQSPGASDGQSLIILDNNKAQRNLNVSHNVAHFTGIHFALLHNAAFFPRNIVLNYDSPAKDQLQGAQIEIVGGKTVEFRPGGTITLENVQPGENRWIAVKYQVSTADAVPIHFLELEHGHPMNAFTILAQPVSVSVAIQDVLSNHVQVFNRLAAAFGANAAKTEAEVAEKLLHQKEISPAQYVGFMKQHVKPIIAILEPFVAKGGGDAFGALKTLKDLSDAVAKNQPEQALSEHAILLQRLDSFSTMLQKGEGDPGDILQMVRWQEALYRTRPGLHGLKCSDRVVQASREFISGYAQRKGDGYLGLLRELGGCFKETAASLDKDRGQLLKAAEAIERNMASIPGLEKAHREFLLALQAVVGTVQN